MITGVRAAGNSQCTTFKAGKVHVFSDFDRTFLPSSQYDFAKNYNIQYVNTIKKTFLNFKKFLEQTRNSLKFTITTGRTFGEFLTMAEIARNRGFSMPLPDSLIVKNGSDEHTKTDTDENFYKGGAFPFKYEVTNKKKEDTIQHASGWNGKKVSQILKDVFKSHDLRIVEADSEHGAEWYEKRSLFATGNLPYEVGKSFYGSNKADWSVGLRKDGNLKTFIAYPIDMYKVEERREALSDIRYEIATALKHEGIAYKMGGNAPTKKNGRKCDSYTPDISSLGYNSLNKDFDTREAVKKAIKSNDLVIAAGDGINDLEMLNPISYLKDSLPKEIINKYPDNILSQVQPLITLLNTDKELAYIFMKIPFIGIIVQQDNKNKDLQILEPFTKGKYQKIVLVNQGELQDGIKQAIKLYSTQNQEYKTKLCKDLSEQLGEDLQSEHKEQHGNSGEGDEPPNNDKNSYWKYILGVVALITAGAIYLTKRKKQQTEKQKNTNDTTN